MNVMYLFMKDRKNLPLTLIWGLIGLLIVNLYLVYSSIFDETITILKPVAWTNLNWFVFWLVLTGVAIAFLYHITQVIKRR